MYKICIIGNDAVGKTTTANFIKELIPDSKVVSYADELKKDLYALDLPVFKKPYSNELRTFVRAYGDLKRQLYGQDYWVKRMHSILPEDPETTIIVDDMRYWSEFNSWTDKWKRQTKVITIGPIIATKPTDANSVIEVNQMLTVLRKDTTANILHIISSDITVVKNQITNYLNNK